MNPPAYPRIPHLAAGRGTSDDDVLDPSERARFLAGRVLVEEKLDGANVALWIDDGRLACSLRSGPDGLDRARQLGPLRAWLAEHGAALHALLTEGRVTTVYAEWLLVTHTVPYDRLPSYLIGLDALGPDGHFVPEDDRVPLLHAAGVATPPALAESHFGNVAAVEALIGASHVGPARMEGVVVRSLTQHVPRLAKLVRAGFAPIDDAQWRSGRPHNTLADRETSWR